jgi:catechol 1,2-dioxygenase
MVETAPFTAQVINALSDIEDVRVKVVLQEFVRHMHEFVVETSLTLDELLAAASFIERSGRHSDENRSEMILMANILGVEVLVDMIGNEGDGQTTVLGPMYRADVPSLPNGASIILDYPDDGQSVYLEGYVHDEQGRPIKGAIVDIWQASTNGLYDVQDPEQTDLNLRGKFTTDEKGYYALRCLRPTAYPIPTDGPGGELLAVLKRHPMRPAHIHAIVSAPGKRKIISQLYDATDAYVKDDAIFAVKETLCLDFKPGRSGDETDLYVRYDFTLHDALSNERSNAA